jgi:spore germination cell wall hydrolase CwlJ-like protein
MHALGWLELGTRLLVLVFAAYTPVTVQTALQSAWTDGKCYASVIHYEARGEPLAGKRAVLDTVIHRMLATGKSACDVVLQKGQFSWANKKPLLPYDESAHELLAEVVSHKKVLISENYKHFYSGPAPYWAKSMMCKRVGGHQFCRGKV